MPGDPRLNDLLSLCEALKNEGKPVSLTEVCRECPELLPELQHRWRAVVAMDGFQAGTGAQESALQTTDQATVEYQRTREQASPDPAIPGYEILGVLGRGGMGVVYRARQSRLGRLVALKMILSGDQAGEQQRERFRIEAESIARLQHPNIVQVHEVGEHEGKPFFSLEFCSGGSLDRKLRGTPLPPTEAARLLETLARAMHAAHQKNVIHRDLKPANVLLTEDGTPKITDFGLAKKLDDPGLTTTEAVMGTPSYMPPEQANGKIQELGPPCDIYALGAILYECLTGRPPSRAPRCWRRWTRCATRSRSRRACSSREPRAISRRSV